MPSDTEIIARFGAVEGRVSVVEAALVHGAKRFEDIRKSVEDARDDFKEEIAGVRQDLREFKKWIRGLVYGIAAYLLMQGFEMVKGLAENRRAQGQILVPKQTP